MSSRYELEILLKARNQAADAFKAINGAVSDLQGNVKEYEGVATKSMAASAGAVLTSKAAWVSAGVAVTAAAAGVGVMARAIYDLAMRGSEIGGVKTSFDLLTASVGGSNAMLQAGRAGTKGLLTDYDLMLNANRLLAARLPVTADQFGALAGQAVVLGRSVGKDATESVNRLALGLSKLEPELLDEINIKVSAVDANKKYAAEIGKSVKELTAYERQIAFVNAVSVQAAERTAALGGLQLTFADHVTIVTNRVKNMYDELAVGVSLSPALMTLIARLGDVILNAFGPDQTRAVQNVVRVVDGFAVNTVRAAEWVVSGVGMMSSAWHGALLLIAGAHGVVAASIEPVISNAEKLFRLLSYTNPVLSKMYGALADEAAAWGREMRLQKESAAVAFKTITEDGLRAQVSLQGLGQKFGDLRREMEANARAGVSQAAVTNSLTLATEGGGKANEAAARFAKSYAKTLEDVTFGLREAEKNQTPANLVIDEYGSKIKNLVREAGVAGKEIPESVQKWYIAVLRNELTPILKRQSDALRMTTADVHAARNQFEKLLVKSLIPLGMIGLPKLIGDTHVLKDKLDNLGVPLKWILDDIDKLDEAFQKTADSSARNILGAFSTLSHGLGGIFGQIGQQWMSMFDAMIAVSEDKDGKLWGWLGSAGGQKVSGGLQVGMQTFTQGYGIGTGLGKTGGTLVGAGAGAAQGALVGTYIMPGIGTGMGALIGGAAGAIGGWLGGRKKDKEDAAYLKELQQDLLSTYGGMDKLRKLSSELGVSIDGAFSSKKPADALRVIERFALATEAHQRAIEGVGMATDALNVRSQFLFGNLKDVDASLVAIGASGQEEFERLGLYAATNLAGIIKHTGNVRGAFEAVGPTLDRLKEAQGTLGLASNDAIDKMLGMRAVVEANGPVLDSLEATTRMTKGWGEAGMMTRDLFRVASADIGSQLQRMIDGGVEVDQALALSGPTLQWLWENSKKYGGITDETTKKLLEQAEAQGLVGDHQKNINQQMLDATLGLSKAVSDLAAALAGELPAAAATAASGIKAQFDGMRFSVPVDFDARGMPGERGGGGEYQGFDSGGTVNWTPGGRLVRVGESRTERIVSDEQLGSIVARAVAGMQGGSGTGTVIIRNEIGGRVLDEHVVHLANQGLRNGQVIVPAKAVRAQVY